MAEMPVVVARTCGRRVSMLRNAETVRCSHVPGPSPNQESFESVTIRRAPAATAAARVRRDDGVVADERARTGSGVGIREDRTRSTVGPSPGAQVPSHGSRRRMAGVSSHAGTRSVSGKSHVLR